MCLFAFQCRSHRYRHRNLFFGHEAGSSMLKRIKLHFFAGRVWIHLILPPRGLFTPSKTWYVHVSHSILDNKFPFKRTQSHHAIKLYKGPFKRFWQLCQVWLNNSFNITVDTVEKFRKFVENNLFRSRKCWVVSEAFWSKFRLTFVHPWRPRG